MATGRPFPKGTSGNPGGRSKAEHHMDRLVPRLIAELTHGGADLVFMLLRIAAGAEPGMEDARSRLWAVRELFDRGVGKPALSVKVSGPLVGDAPALDDRPLTDDELRVLAKLDEPAPAKVLQLVAPVPVESPGHGGGNDSG